MRRVKKLNILAIGSHPDDIEFGCGGTLIKMLESGHNIYMLVLTKGELGGEVPVRRREQEAAARFIGVKKLFWGGFKDTLVPSNKDAISLIEEMVKETSADIVFVNHQDDTHQDHRIAAESTISSTRYVNSVFFYEVPTTQRFNPNLFVDISAVLKDKLKLLTLHRSQISRTGVNKLSILESAKSCANFRGFQARVRYAEGFKSLRFLIDL